MAEPTAATDLGDAIARSASGPASFSVDGESAQEHSIPDQIAADKHLRNKQAATANANFGLRFMKCNPPGTQ